MDRPFSCSPFTPKRVLTSPTALPASSNDTGISVAICCMMSSMSSSASPVAPVLRISASIPESTSLNAATAATPTATMGAVSFSVTFLPTSVMLSPVSFSLPPTALSFWAETVPKSLYSSVRSFRFCSVSMISRCSASYSSGDRAAFWAFFSSFRRVLVSLMADWSPFCFCVSRSVFPGSLFSSLATSLRLLPVVCRRLSTSFRAVCSLVLSPPISIVMPAMRLFAMSSPPKIGQNPPGLPAGDNPGCRCCARWSYPPARRIRYSPDPGASAPAAAPAAASRRRYTAGLSGAAGFFLAGGLPAPAI